MDQEEGLLYVLDAGNNRVDVFDADTRSFIRAFGWGVLNGNAELQTCTTTCQAGLAGSGAGQLNSPTGIAVDNDSTSPAFHDVYVFDGQNRRVVRFHPSGEFVKAFGSAGGLPEQFDASDNPLAVGSGGVIYVGGQGTGSQSRVQKFTHEGGFIEEIEPLMAKLCGGGFCATTVKCETEGVEEPLQTRVIAIAVDSAGDLYVATGAGTGAVRKYDATGSLLDPCKPINPSFNIQALAIDLLDDHLFVGDLFGVRGIAEYDPSGAELRVIYGATEYRSSALAPYSSAAGDIFAVSSPFAGTRKVVQIAFEPPGPVILPFDGIENPGRKKPFASNVSNTKATLNAEVNPEGETTTYEFEYVDEESFQDEGIGGPATESVEGTVGSTGSFTLTPVSDVVGCLDPKNEAELPDSKCLTPETVYHWQVRASNGDGDGNSPIGGPPFETGPPLVFGPIWSTEVGTVEAALHGEVNPQSIPAGGWFEYVDDTTFQASGFAEAIKVPDVDIGEAPIDFGDGEAFLPRAVQLASLSPGTTYHYRLAAQNPLLLEPIFSPERTFHTFALPTPDPDPDPCPNAQLRTGASAALPDCRAYELVSPVDKGGGDIVSLLESNHEQSALDGQSITYSSYRAFADPESAPFTSQLLAHRGEEGWRSEAIATPREGPSLFGLKYRIANQYKLFSDDLCQAWVTTENEPLLDSAAIPGYPNLYRRESCGPGAGSYEALTRTLPTEPDPENFDPKPQAFSADGSLSVFTAEGQLSPEGAFCDKAEGEFCTRQLYAFRRGAEKEQFVCFLPDGTPSANACAAGFIRGVLGTVGQRLDDAYHTVSEDGSRVFWTALPASGVGAGPLYVRVNPDQEQSAVEGGECTDAVKACTLAVSTSAAHFRTASADGQTVIYTEGEFNGGLHEFDVEAALAGEVGADTEIAADARNVLGASEDARLVYFVSDEATLSEGANSNGDKAKAGQPNLYLHEAGTGGGAGSYAFIATLAGTDTATSVNGLPSLRRSRLSPDGGHLAFVSAAPLTGYDNRDAASGKADSEVFLYDAEAAELRCVSCNPTGGRPVGADLNPGAIEEWTAATIPAWLNGVHFSHILSDNGGRLFFESVDPLVLRDTNGAIDVYGWELAGSGKECEEAGADLYSEAAGGCISLISSGRSPGDSSLLDASADGTDVFIKTAASLLSHDPGLIDIYDARIGGGFPPPPTPPPPCEGEACQSPPPPPEEVTPASSAFEGPGNLKEEGQARKPRCPKGKRKVRRGGKVRCVKKQKRGNRRADRNQGRAAR